MISESDEQSLRENAKNQLETIRALRVEVKSLGYESEYNFKYMMRYMMFIRDNGYYREYKEYSDERGYP